MNNNNPSPFPNNNNNPSPFPNNNNGSKIEKNPSNLGSKVFQNMYFQTNYN
jgi:hypothetical protein